MTASSNSRDAPDYVVLRCSPDMPAKWMPEDTDGRWYDISTWPEVNPTDPRSAAIATPTGRFEVRDDGAVAEVWECRPRRASDA